MTPKRQTGFTIIELVIVIVIIGILAAIAVPKFISAQTDARVAKMNALFGSVRIAAALAKSRCELDLAANPVGTCTAAAGTVNMDGTSVSMVNKYPAAPAIANVNTGIVAAAGLLTAGAANPTTDGSNGLTVTYGNPITFDAVGATTAANCRISYTAATAVLAPVITVITSGC